MAKIIPKIHENELPEELAFALKYADIEACFTSRSKRDIYLDVVFQNKQFSDRKVRDRLEAQGIFQLLKFKFDPENKLMTAWQWENGPWKDTKNATIVEAWIYGLPRELSTSVGLSRPKLQKILEDEVKSLLPKGEEWGQRKLTLRLLVKDLAIESTLTRWNGGEKPEEVTKLIPLGSIKKG